MSHHHFEISTLWIALCTHHHAHAHASLQPAQKEQQEGKLTMTMLATPRPPVAPLRQVSEPDPNRGSVAYDSQDNNDNWSIEVNDLLQDLDRFTLSSGKSIPLRTTRSPLNSSTASSPPIRYGYPSTVNDENAAARSCLQEASRERESTREWAHAMRESVNKWMKEQKETLRSSSLQFQTEKTMYEETIRNMKAKIDQLQQDLKESLERYLQVELHLYSTIEGQKARIRELEQQVETATKETRRHRRNAASPQTPRSNSSSSSSKTINSSSSRRQRMLLDSGAELIIYRNGSQKEVHPDGTTVTKFPNGDIETKTRLTTAYYYMSSNTIQVTFHEDQSVVWEYPNGHMERHWPDGRKIIRNTKGEMQRITANGACPEILDPNESIILEKNRAIF